MKKYPSIQHDIVRDIDIYAFDKLDGSNTRAEWSKKNGFYKFGSRGRLIDQSDSLLGPMPGIFLAKYGVALEKIFREYRWTKVTVFTEYWGPSSFAGNHNPDEEHTVTLIDISVDKNGILIPRLFLKVIGDLDHAKLLYTGKANNIFESQVRDGTLDGMTFEGVVCKGPFISPGRPLMFKIKNQAWFDKLKYYCKGDQELYNTLL